MANNKVSIIIVNLNGCHFLEKLFMSLAEQSFSDFEVIFLDNGSFDGSVRKLRELLKCEPMSKLDVKIISYPENLGYCKANNKAFEYSQGEYLVLLNNDTYVDSKWLEELVIPLDNDESLGACQSKILFAKTGSVQSIGNYVGTYGKGSDSVKKLCYANGLVKNFFNAMATALAVRRKAINDSGPFDDKLFYGDVDLCWRLRLVGFDIASNLRSICFHIGSYATKKTFSVYELSYFQFREKIRILFKNYSYTTFIKRFPVYFVTVLLHAFFLSIKHKKPCLFSLFKAYIWNLRNFKDTFIQHLKVQSSKVVSDKKLEEYMLPYPIEILNFKKKC